MQRTMIVVCVSFIAGIGVRSASIADDSTPAHIETIDQIEVGFKGYFKVGLWTPLQIVTQQVAERWLPLNQFEITLSAPEPAGNLVQYPVAFIQDAETKRLHGWSVFKCGKLDGDLTITLSHNGTILETRTINCANPPADVAVKPLRQSEPLIVTAGNPTGFDKLDQLWINPSVNTETPPAVAAFDSLKRLFSGPAEISADKMPQFLQGINLLVVNGSSVSHDIGEDVQNWVASGGHLLLAIKEEERRPLAEPLWEFFGIEVEAGTGKRLIPREVSNLETFAKSTEGVPFGTSLEAAQISVPDGETLISGLNTPLMSQFAYGMGRVTCLAIALDGDGPLSRWKALPQFYGQAFTEVEQKSTTIRRTERRRLSRTGINELATQLIAIQDHFPEISRFSSWKVMSLMVIYLLIIGPIDYLLVHKVFRRPQLTWVTFPLLVVVTGLAAMQVARAANGAHVRVNQLEIIDLDQSTGWMDCRSSFNLYSPETAKYSISAEGEVPQFNGDRSNNSPNTAAIQAYLEWQGRPEDGPGGMYRTGGVQFSSSTYNALVGGSAMKNVPITIWSTKALQASWNAITENLVESELTSTGLGQLSGSIVHHLPVPIEDWIVAYQNQVYRPRVEEDLDYGTWPAHFVWNPQSSRVHHRELKGYLTRAKYYKVAKKDGFGEDILIREDAYDPLDLSPTTFARVLTFHQATGGTSYSGLQNSAAKVMDLSWALEMKRAVLFGRIDNRFTQLEVNGQPVEVDRHSAFIRILLPVKHVVGGPRILPDPSGRLKKPGQKVSSPVQLRNEARRKRQLEEKKNK